MTPKQKQLHASLIKALHISRRYKEYYKENRDEYKELLSEHFGVESSKELGIDELIGLVEWMNFKLDVLPQQKAYHHCTQAQLRMMQGLWNSFARDSSEDALLEFVNRIIHKRYLHLHMLSKSEAQKVIPVLKKMQK